MKKKVGKQKINRNPGMFPLVFASIFVALGISVYLICAGLAGWNSGVWMPVVLAACILPGVISLFFHSGNLRFAHEENARLKAEGEWNAQKLSYYKSAFQRHASGLAVFDSALCVVAYNEAYEKIAGKPDGDIVSTNLKAMIGNQRCSEGGTPAMDLDGFSTVQRFIRPGSDIWARIRFTALDQNGNTPVRYLCIVEDQTENMAAIHALRESERSKSVFLSNLPGMAYRCNYDREWTMQVVSDGCFTLTGYQPESLLKNRDLSFNDLILPAYREIIWNEWSRVLAQKAAFQYEYEIRTATGEIKWVREQGQGIFDEQGEVCALEGLIFDVTVRKKREIENRYLTEHDMMTGLHNRGFFQQEKVRLNNEACLPLAVIIANINGVRLINDAFGHAEGDQLIIMTAKMIQKLCRPGDVLARTGGDEFGILLPGTDYKAASDLVKSIKKAFLEYNRGVSKDSSFISISLGCAVKTSMDENTDSVFRSAEDYMYKQKLLDRKSSHSAILSSIKATLFARSQETEEHAERLAKLSVNMGTRLNLPQTRLDELELLAILHDIGKIGIDDRILNKPDKLNEEEWRMMKKHPEIGFRIAMSSPVFQPIAECILFHHERWDGGGYPHGLRGGQIPLLSRILAVADAYDAMTEDRPYRRAMARNAAIAEIRDNSGKQFDPDVVRAFLEIESRA